MPTYLPLVTHRIHSCTPSMMSPRFHGCGCHVVIALISFAAVAFLFQPALGSGQKSLVIARESLLTKVLQEGLKTLKSNLADISIPDQQATMDVPAFGSVDFSFSNIHLVQFDLSTSNSQLRIVDDALRLQAVEMYGLVKYSFTWSKSGLGGNGNGTLDLKNGTLDLEVEARERYPGRVYSNYEDYGDYDSGLTVPRPTQLVVNEVQCKFDKAEAAITEGSLEWVQQFMLWLMGNDMSGFIEDLLENSLKGPIPRWVNKMLDKVPYEVYISRLIPFDVDFQYDVTVKDDVRGEMYNMLRVAPQYDTLCPIEAPSVEPPAIPAHEQYMASAYVSAASLNCLFISLFDSYLGFMSRVPVFDGIVPNLDFSGVMRTLLPEVAERHPDLPIVVVLSLTAPPEVGFSSAANAGITASASYVANVFVRNITNFTRTYSNWVQGYNRTEYGSYVPVYTNYTFWYEDYENVFVASLACNLTIVGGIAWDSTTIHSVTARHTIRNTTIPSLASVATRLDSEFAAAVKRYGEQYTVRSLINYYITFPWESYVSMVSPTTIMYDGWYTFHTNGSVSGQLGSALASISTTALASSGIGEAYGFSVLSVSDAGYSFQTLSDQQQRSPLNGTAGNDLEQSERNGNSTKQGGGLDSNTKLGIGIGVGVGGGVLLLTSTVTITVYIIKKRALMAVAPAASSAV